VTWVRDWLDDPTASVPWIRRGLMVLLVCQALAFLARGADRPADPYLKGRVTVTVAPAPPTTVAPAGLPGG
jgi:hypothetical protein